MPLVEEEGFFDLEPGNFEVEGIKGWVEHQSVGVVLRSFSGRVSGIQTIGVNVRDYRTYYDPSHMYLPVFYGTPADLDVLWGTGECVLCEGIFDRIAIKRAFPAYSVLARLTKGLSPPILRLFERSLRRLWVCFDMDGPGERASEKAERRVKHVEVIRLGFSAKDPGELYEKRGVAGVRAAFERQFRTMGI